MLAELAARMPSPKGARALRLAAGVPVMTALSVVFDTEGEVVDDCDTVMAADRYVLSYELPAR
jgi:GntR family transcriptional regulator